MVQIEGKYVCEKNENLNEFFSSIGVPFVPRKIMCNSSPSMEIKKEGEKWTITTITLFRTAVTEFKLGEEFEEDMPGGKLRCVTTMEGDNKLVTNTKAQNGTTVTRTYEFTDDQCLITYQHGETGTIGKRYFKRT
ncbi:unnamed protein product [Acanthoscelides obtectus]|uniref:Lipocalin/cytosolic fatty-acid binding domain-containing protein n=1 Tax=Acanthoscelides obtectus TaxID=200917 RepID=A0A9P0KLA6_ACAOB|nr:unnamed protein product [Acanthoscelides obtectus]CAK1633098.1 hypothetical protein AOBTE_LOCUS7948 [Acanthoscelides obtectus]